MKNVRDECERVTRSTGDIAGYGMGGWVAMTGLEGRRIVARSNVTNNV